MPRGGHSDMHLLGRQADVSMGVGTGYGVNVCVPMCALSITLRRLGRCRTWPLR